MPRRLSAYELVSKSTLLQRVPSAVCPCMAENWLWPSTTEPRVSSRFIAGVLKPPRTGELARGRGGDRARGKPSSSKGPVSDRGERGDLLFASRCTVGDLGELREGTMSLQCQTHAKGVGCSLTMGVRGRTRPKAHGFESDGSSSASPRRRRVRMLTSSHCYSGCVARPWERWNRSLW